MKHIILATAVTVLLPTAALATPTSAADAPAASGRSSSIGVELGFNTRDSSQGSITTFAPRIDAFAMISPNLAISAGWGLTTVDAESLAGGAHTLNPALGLHLTPDLGPVRLRVGILATLPLASSGEASAALESARILRGGYEPWLYLPDTFAAAIPLRAELTVFDAVDLALEAAAFTYMGTAADAETQFAGQGAVEALLRLGMARLGARAQMVRGAPELDQLSVEPMARLELDAVVVEGRLTFNLEQPELERIEDQLWGAHLGVAYRY